jgi:polyhydroxybutyrate depolymerase
MRKLAFLALLAMSTTGCDSHSPAADLSSQPRDAITDVSSDMPASDAAATDTTISDGPSSDAPFDARPDHPDHTACTAHVSGRLTLRDQSPIVGAWKDRSYDLFVPQAYNCHSPIPLIIALHGGGANKEHMEALSCPATQIAPRPDIESAGCLNAYARSANMAVVYPNGTGSVVAPDIRTYNATNTGAPLGRLTCVSGPACQSNVSDVQYIRDLLADLRSRINVGPVFVTGFSNGAAMAHRLACELAGIVAIAPIAGGNQFAALGSCRPAHPVSVLQIHGDQDANWIYLGGAAGIEPGDKVAIAAHLAVTVEPDTISSWIKANGCKDVPAVQSVAGGTRHDYAQCAAVGVSVTLYTVAGGGHTCPGGWQYGPAAGRCQGSCRLVRHAVA